MCHMQHRCQMHCGQIFTCLVTAHKLDAFKSMYFAGGTPHGERWSMPEEEHLGDGYVRKKTCVTCLTRCTMLTVFAMPA